ncbi:MAG: transporter [Burkholderiales bacterium]
MRFMLASAIAAMASAGTAFANCGAAVCSVTSNWNVQSVQPVAGSGRLDLRYEFIDQSRPWRGTRRTDVAGDDEATETRTLNRNLTAALDYAFTDHWAVGLSLPVLSRGHDHIAAPQGTPQTETWNATRLGDARVTASWRNADDKEPTRAAGVTAGLKLPTGTHRMTNRDNVPAERSLQPGTGSTDAILGAFATAPGSNGGLWFASVAFQAAVTVRDQYRPGNQWTVTGGYRHPVTPHLAAALQLNATARQRDTGVQAESDVTGGSFVFVSPGLSWGVSPVTELYAFVQAPVYRNVRGAQLTFDWAAVAGVSHRF